MSTPNPADEILTSDEALTWPQFTTIWNRQTRTWPHSFFLLPQDTWDLVDIYLSGPSVSKVLDRYWQQEAQLLDLFKHAWNGQKHLLMDAFKHAMNGDIEHAPGVFFFLYPSTMLLVMIGAVGAYLDAFHATFKTLLAVGCFYAVNWNFAFAGHSTLDLGEAMDKEKVCQTRTDTDLMGTLGFLGMLVCVSLSQIVCFTLFGGYFGLFLSLILTLTMLGLATWMNHMKVAYTVHDQRILWKEAQAKKQKRIDEKDQKIVSLESWNEHLQFQIQELQKTSEVEEQVIINLRTADHQKELQVQSYETALKNERATINHLTNATKVLRDSLVKTFAAQAKQLIAQKKDLDEEAAKEKAQAVQAAEQKIYDQLNEELKKSNSAMKLDHSKAIMYLMQKYKTAVGEERKRRDDMLAAEKKLHLETLASKDARHTVVLAENEKHYQEGLVKEKAEARFQGGQMAIHICNKFHYYELEAAERRHAEALKAAVLEKDRLQEEKLAAKDSDLNAKCKEVEEKLADFRRRFLKFWQETIVSVREERATKLAEKGQELAGLKERMSRYPELFLVEEEFKGVEQGADDADDEGARADDVNGERRESAEEQEEDIGEGYVSMIVDHTASDWEAESDKENENPIELKSEEQDIQFCSEGDDSEDELRHWALVDSGMS